MVGRSSSSDHLSANQNLGRSALGTLDDLRRRMGPEIVAAFIEVNMNLKHMTITWKQIKEAILFKRSSAKAAKA